MSFATRSKDGFHYQSFNYNPLFASYKTKQTSNVKLTFDWNHLIFDVLLPDSRVDQSGRFEPDEGVNAEGILDFPLNLKNK